MKAISYEKQAQLPQDTDYYEYITLREPQDTVFFVSDILTDKEIEDEFVCNGVDRQLLAASLGAVEIQNHGDYWGVYKGDEPVPSVRVYNQRYLNHYGNFCRVMRVVRGLLGDAG